MSEDETWFGGFYEAAIVLGKTGGATADERLREALTSLWTYPNLRLGGALDLNDLDNLGRIEGELDHPSLGPLVFGTAIVREREIPNGDDWLYAVVPMGGLEERVPEIGGWPAGDHPHSRRWREPLEHALGELALHVARSTPISLAMIGYEIAGVISDFKPDAPRRVGFVARSESGDHQYWPTTDWS
ncbi:MAG: hypothetical protein JNM59_03465 [Hyphomonadaceae bacterium]|nr:hypothetical protein [Hyphomonadaceae bacterium]